jgi:hypothetical protein
LRTSVGRVGSLLFGPHEFLGAASTLRREELARLCSAGTLFRQCRELLKPRDRFDLSGRISLGDAGFAFTLCSPAPVYLPPHSTATPIDLTPSFQNSDIGIALVISPVIRS